jgi:hypothetical protein
MRCPALGCGGFVVTIAKFFIWCRGFSEALAGRLALSRDYTPATVKPAWSPAERQDEHGRAARVAARGGGLDPCPGGCARPSATAVWPPNRSWMAQSVQPSIVVSL